MVIFLIIAGIIVLYLVSMYNSLIKLNNKVEEGFSTMDVYLKKRWDLIPNLVELLKSYMKHEKTTLEEVVKLRNSSYDNMSNEDKMNVNNKLTTGISKIIALAENYPDLKANQSFIELNNSLTVIEEDIANARKYYNGTVRMFNDKVLVFPTNIISSLFGFKSKKMFEIEETQRENIKIDL